MSETTRISAATLARRLGPTAETAAAACLPRAGRPDPGRGARRPARRRHRTAQRTRTGGGAFAVPDHRRAPPTRCCANRAGWIPDAAPAVGSGCRRATPAPPGRRSPTAAVASFNAGGIFGWQDGVGWHETVPPSADPPATIDLTTACLPAPAEPLAAAVQAAAEQLSRIPGRRRLPALRAAGAAGGDRRQVRGRGRADHRRADPDHVGRPARLHAHRRRVVGARRPGADRMPDLPGRARRAAGQPPDTGAGRTGRTRSVGPAGGQCLGRRSFRCHPAADRAAARLSDPGLPEPDRRADGCRDPGVVGVPPPGPPARC